MAIASDVVNAHWSIGQSENDLYVIHRPQVAIDALTKVGRNLVGLHVRRNYGVHPTIAIAPDPRSLCGKRARFVIGCTGRSGARLPGLTMVNAGPPAY